MFVDLNNAHHFIEKFKNNTFESGLMMTHEALSWNQQFFCVT